MAPITFQCDYVIKDFCIITLLLKNYNFKGVKMRNILLILVLVLLVSLVFSTTGIARTVIIEAGRWSYGTTQLDGGGVVYSYYTPLDGLKYGKGSVRNYMNLYVTGPWVTYTQTSQAHLPAKAGETDYAYYARKAG